MQTGGATDELPGVIPGAERAGDWIGNYCLLELLGEGSFGDVWLARQEVPVRREVAVKILKLGLDTEVIVRRFELERQALAMMDHPNISNIHDAGATASGRLFSKILNEGWMSLKIQHDKPDLG